jgi:hypothetical protein
MTARRAFTKISKNNMVTGNDDLPLSALRNVLLGKGEHFFTALLTSVASCR